MATIYRGNNQQVYKDRFTCFAWLILPSIAGLVTLINSFYLLRLQITLYIFFGRWSSL